MLRVILVIVLVALSLFTVACQAVGQTILLM